jgi:predicted ATPase
MPEAGRAIIREQVATGGRALPWVDPAAFAELMLARDVRAHRNARHQHGLVFFDRGIPDVAGYMRLSGLAVPAHMDHSAKMFRYNGRVFIMPPWRDIFTQDSERKQDFDVAVRTYETLATTYADYGYELMEVPRTPIEQRTRFILQNAGAA